MRFETLPKLSSMAAKGRHPRKTSNLDLIRGVGKAKNDDVFLLARMPSSPPLCCHPSFYLANNVKKPFLNARGRAKIAAVLWLTVASHCCKCLALQISNLPFITTFTRRVTLAASSSSSITCLGARQRQNRKTTIMP